MTSHPATLPADESADLPSGRWIVANTHPKREQYAQENLARQGFRPYAPRIMKRVTRFAKTRDVSAPLFPSYIFINVDPAMSQWRPILSTYGVRAVIGGDRPSMLDSRFIDELKAREVDGFIRPPGVEWVVGQEAAIREGPMSGLVGQIVELRDRERIVLLMDILNRSVRLTLDADQLSPC